MGAHSAELHRYDEDPACTASAMAPEQGQIRILPLDQPMKNRLRVWCAGAGGLVLLAVLSRSLAWDAPPTPVQSHEGELQPPDANADGPVDAKAPTVRVSMETPQGSDISLPADLPTTMAALLDAHLKPAPMELQRRAARLADRQEQHFLAEAAAISSTDLESAIKLNDSLFAARIRALAKQRLAEGRGVIAIDGRDYATAVQDSHYFLALAQAEKFGLQVGVLVVVDKDDPQLRSTEDLFSDLRRTQVFSRCAVFNNRPDEDRAASIRSYEADRAAGRARRPELFGLELGDLDLVRIDDQAFVLLLK